MLSHDTMWWALSIITEYNYLRKVNWWSNHVIWVGSAWKSTLFHTVRYSTTYSSDACHCSSLYRVPLIESIITLHADLFLDDWSLLHFLLRALYHINSLLTHAVVCVGVAFRMKYSWFYLFFTVLIAMSNGLDAVMNYFTCFLVCYDFFCRP